MAIPRFVDKFQEQRAKMLAEAEEAIKNAPEPGRFEKIKRLRRKHRKKMATVESTIQTYRIYVTLECGHRTTFTLSRKTFVENSWRKRRLECNDCAKADPEWPKGMNY